MGIPIPPVPTHREPTNGELLAVLNAQSGTLNKLDRTMHGEKPDGSDGMKARVLSLEGQVDRHARRFARSDRLVRRGVWGTLGLLGSAAVAGFIAKVKVLLGGH